MRDLLKFLAFLAVLLAMVIPFIAYTSAMAKPDDRRARAESPYSNQSMRREREAKRIIREIERSERPRHFVWPVDRPKERK